MTSDKRPDAFDLDLIRSQHSDWDLHFFPELGSTNDWALREFRHRALPRPAVILAQRQTSGRGRGSHLWQAPPGNLTFTLALTVAQPPAAIPTHPVLSPTSTLDWPVRLALATPLAVRQSVIELNLRAACQIKWPNDLLINNQKLAGILIESLPAPQSGPPHEQRGTTFVIGIGLNVNSAPSLGTAAEERPSLAPTSLASVLKHPLDLTTVLLKLLAQLQLWYRKIEVFPQTGFRFDQSSLLDAYNQALCWRGERVTLNHGQQSLTGELLGVNQSGHLQIQTPAGPVPIASGELRIAPPGD